MIHGNREGEDVPAVPKPTRRNGNIGPSAEHVSKEESPPSKGRKPRSVGRLPRDEDEENEVKPEPETFQKWGSN